MNRLARLYDRLTPDERLCAFVDALARKDDQELDRLNETCPRKTYVCDDWAYRGRLRDLWILAMNHALDIQRLGQAILVLLALLLNAETKGDEPRTNTCRRSLSGSADASLPISKRGGSSAPTWGSTATVPWWRFSSTPWVPWASCSGRTARDLLNLEPDAEEVARRAEELRDFWRHAVRRADGANRLCTS